MRKEVFILIFLIIISAFWIALSNAHLEIKNAEIFLSDGGFFGKINNPLEKIVVSIFPKSFYVKPNFTVSEHNLAENKAEVIFTFDQLDHGKQFRLSPSTVKNADTTLFEFQKSILIADANINPTYLRDVNEYISTNSLEISKLNHDSKDVDLKYGYRLIPMGNDGLINERAIWQGKSFYPIGGLTGECEMGAPSFLGSQYLPSSQSLKILGIRRIFGASLLNVQGGMPLLSYGDGYAINGIIVIFEIPKNFIRKNWFMVIVV